MLENFNDEHWRASFNGLLKRDIQASRSWSELIGVGIDADTLAGLLALCCDFKGSPGYELLGPLLKPDAREIRAMLGLADQLNATSNALLGILGDKADRDLVAKLNATAASLRSSIADAETLFSKRTLNPGFFLAWLISDLEEKSRKPHYRHVANLLAPAYMAHGQPHPDIGEEAIRKMYGRFRKSNPLARFITPEGKRALPWVALVVVVLALIEKAAGTKNSDDPTTLLEHQLKADT
jgi:hypothetical protein